MGLDIYFRYGRLKSPSMPTSFIGWSKGGEYEKEYLAQMTGYVTAAADGYIRESWGSLRMVEKCADAVGIQSPYMFFPNWQGFNGEHLDVSSPEKLEPVLQFRDLVIKPFIESFDEAAVQAKIDAASLFGNEAKALLGRYVDVLTFIDALEALQDKPNLCIIFG